MYLPCSCKARFDLVVRGVGLELRVSRASCKLFFDLGRPGGVRESSGALRKSPAVESYSLILGVRGMSGEGGGFPGEPG